MAIVKDILWVEDFSEQPAILSDDLKTSADRTDEVQSVFGDEFSRRVTLLEDMTDLPGHMEQHPHQYELFILDLDLSQSLPWNRPEKWSGFLCALKPYGIGRRLQPERLAALDRDELKALLIGCTLATYLVEACHIARENIVFLTAFREDDIWTELDALDLDTYNLSFCQKSTDPNPSSKSPLQALLRDRFRPQDLTDRTVITLAKELLQFWIEYDDGQNGPIADEDRNRLGPLLDYALTQNPKKSVAPDTVKEKKKERVEKIQEALAARRLDLGDILGDAFFLFENAVQPSSIKSSWDKSLANLCKATRNMYHHPSAAPASPIPSKEEFLILFSLALRAMFERADAPVDKPRPPEEILLNALRGKPRTSVSDHKMREMILNWYWDAIFNRGFLTDSYDVFIKPDQSQHLPQDLVRFFCIKAKSIRLRSFKHLNSDSSADPCITCYFKADNSSKIPLYMQQLADAYIINQVNANCSGKYEDFSERFL